ncbi:MAG TPA: glutamate formimidoyltransferase [Spirochaetaceae bacterium]|nr:glutamate formimidoyltransferase [Spirochaetaceae bacterium]HBO39899.1 glutamate formimidoyltransferase [Spirochaetaceae bacterium]HCQ87193.1 glutamate formimidoyltransferase [Spirochaetaceae bacterium]
MAIRKLVECVPNFSEGRNKATIEAIARAISAVAGVSLLDVDPGADTNRTVYTLVGEPAAVVEAAVRAAACARGLIDMRQHAGAHPRMGALDVCPFVPVAGVSMEECVELAKQTAARLAAEVGVPVYLYEYAASRPERRSLADIRAGEYEALPEKLKQPDWVPDYGPAEFVPEWGASVVGAREFLIAYNVNLNTRDAKLANEVALDLREAGRPARDAAGKLVKDAGGKTVKLPGLLKHVRAIGWYIEDYRCAQISINLTNYLETPLHVVYETARAAAEKRGLYVTGSEVVGLVPLAPLVDAGRYFLAKAGKSSGAPEAELVELAIRSMGLASVAVFDPAKKIIEYTARPSAPLMALSANAFVDEVSSDSPAPGGGSVAALAGSLGAALAAMVANLTVGKKGYEGSWAAMSDLAVRAQAIKAQLARAVDEDTAAFNSVMAAMKLPKANPAEQAARDAAIQAGYQSAANVPLETARACLEALKLAGEAVAGNRNSASDAGVAALMARAGLHGAALNVLINLGSISDALYTANMKVQVAQLRKAADERCAKIIAEVEALFT